jgi:membrane protein insertase Oxa1/YidC/SpoIIIJ
MMPDPEMMNKIMLYGMPVMVAVFTYSLFAWVGLYWLISTLFMILQQLFVNRVLKK